MTKKNEEEKEKKKKKEEREYIFEAHVLSHLSLGPV